MIGKMTEIVIPIATLWMMIVMAPLLAFVCIGGIFWGGKGFLRSCNMLLGAGLLPPKATRTSVLAALVIFAAVVAIALAMGFGVVAMLTTQPYRVTDAGITVGARPPDYRPRFIPWSQITHIACRMRWRGRRKRDSIYIYTTQGRETLPSTVPLEPLYLALKQHLPEGAAEPCF
jgi:hypothetical protein